jgi:MFS family permease
MDRHPDVFLGIGNDFDGNRQQLWRTHRRSFLLGYCGVWFLSSWSVHMYERFSIAKPNTLSATYLLTIWYRRYEVQKRMAVFYTAASLSGAFSGLLAYGIEQMDGISGLGGWQWIFILEGLVPVALSLVVWKLLPDVSKAASRHC